MRQYQGQISQLRYTDIWIMKLRINTVDYLYHMVQHVQCSIFIYTILSLKMHTSFICFTWSHTPVTCAHVQKKNLKQHMIWKHSIQSMDGVWNGTAKHVRRNCLWAILHITKIDTSPNQSMYALNLAKDTATIAAWFGTRKATCIAKEVKKKQCLK